MVCHVLGHHRRQEQIHPGDGRIAQRRPLPVRWATAFHLCEKPSSITLFAGQNADPGRKQTIQRHWQRDIHGRHLGNPDKKPLFLGKAQPHSRKHYPLVRLGRKIGSTDKLFHKKRHPGHDGRSLLAAHLAKENQPRNRKDAPRDMAQLGSILPRRGQLFTLRRAVQETDRTTGHGILGNVQRLGRLLRRSIQPIEQRHAAYARQRHLLRIHSKRRVG